MDVFEVDGIKYIVRKRFSKSRIKDLDALQKVKGFYNADTVVLDNRNDLVIVADRVLEATILEETTDEQPAIYQSEG